MRLINVSFTLLFITFICKTTTSLHPKHVGSKGENKTVYGKIQSTRKTLKRVRKWKTAHKAEVNLVKCVSKYLEYPIPGLRRRDDSEYQYVLEDGVSSTAEPFHSRYIRQLDESQHKKGIVMDDKVQVPMLVNVTTSVDVLNAVQGTKETDEKINTCKLSRIWASFVLLGRFIRDKIYEPFLAPFWRHKLFVCGKDYAVSKFWAWVDAAPE